MTENASAREEYVLANGLRHRVLRWGSGHELILICHGYLDSAETFDQLAEELVKRDFSVCAFDWRGHGKSERIGAGGYYHFADYVVDLDQVITALGESQVHLVGHSMGGTVACLFAPVRPTKLRSLTLLEGLGPPEFSLDELPKRMKSWLDGSEKARNRSRHAMPDLNDAAKRLKAWHSMLSNELALRVAEQLTHFDADAGGYIWNYDPLHKTVGPYPFRVSDFSQYLKAIEQEVHLIFGSKGMRLPDEQARAAAIPKTKTSIIEGAPHMMHWTHPAELAETIARGIQMK